LTSYAHKSSMIVTGYSANAPQLFQIRKGEKMLKRSASFMVVI